MSIFTYLEMKQAELQTINLKKSFILRKREKQIKPTFRYANQVV